MAVIFRKQLRLSSQGRSNHSTGEIVNYIAVDAYRLGDAINWLHMGWSSPLQLVFAVATLFWALKLGALPGLVPLVIFGFLNVPFAKMMQGYQAKFMVAQDERLRSTSEILNSMKIIKLQSWEDKFRHTIESLRDGEFKWLRETQMKKAYGAVMYWMSPTVVSAVMFTATAIMGSAPLNASRLFTVLATLRVMAEPVRFLPEILTTMIQYKVSLDRIEKFLLEDEIREGDVKRVPSDNSDVRIQVQDGNFSWKASGADLSLRNVNLRVNRGEKVAVCGPVGSGKSSLLYALLGEIPRLSGSVSDRELNAFSRNKRFQSYVLITENTKKFVFCRLRYLVQWRMFHRTRGYRVGLFVTIYSLGSRSTRNCMIRQSNLVLWTRILKILIMETSRRLVRED
jgi:ABC-type multidrug transport system fused ATPase/permease subunit